MAALMRTLCDAESGEEEPIDEGGRKRERERRREEERRQVDVGRLGEGKEGVGTSLQQTGRSRRLAQSNWCRGKPIRLTNHWDDESFGNTRARRVGSFANKVKLFWFHSLKGEPKKREVSEGMYT